MLIPIKAWESKWFIIFETIMLYPVMTLCVAPFTMLTQGFRMGLITTLDLAWSMNFDNIEITKKKYFIVLFCKGNQKYKI